MARSYSLGTIAGVPLRATPTLLVLFAAIWADIWWQLAASFDGYPQAAYAGCGLLGAAVFMWTVLAHEAAHVAAARRYRARVGGVTLSLFGGVSAIGGEPRRPWQGAVVALAGPAVSILVGLLCGGAAVGLVMGSAPVLLAASLAIVAVFNILLAICNLLPGAPLDGGHVLQAVVWALSGDRVKATVFAARAGQLLAGLFVAAGLTALASGASWATAGALFVGAWPVWRGAVVQRRVVLLRRALAGVRVGDLLGAVAFGEDASSLPRADADEPLADLLERAHGHTGPAAVYRGGELVGVLPAAAISHALETAQQRKPVAAQPAGDLWPGPAPKPRRIRRRWGSSRRTRRARRRS